MQNIIFINIFISIILTYMYLGKYKKLKNHLNNVATKERGSYTKLLVVYCCSAIIFLVMQCFNVILCKELSFDSKVVVIEQQTIFLVIQCFSKSDSEKHKELLLEEKRELIINFTLIALLSFSSFLGIFFQ